MPHDFRFFFGLRTSRRHPSEYSELQVTLKVMLLEVLCGISHECVKQYCSHWKECVTGHHANGLMFPDLKIGTQCVVYSSCDMG
jgi:hypothetical protein